MDLISK